MLKSRSSLLRHTGETGVKVDVADPREFLIATNELWSKRILVCCSVEQPHRTKLCCKINSRLSGGEFPLSKIPLDEEWFFGRKRLDTVSSFYLGVTLTPTLSFVEHLKDKASAAKRALNSIYRSFFRQNNIPLNSKYGVFMAAIKTILNYTAQVWGYGYYGTVEQVQAYFVKMMASLPPNTPNYMVQHEASVEPIFLTTLALHCGYIRKVSGMPMSRYPKLVAVETRHRGIFWAKELKRLADYNRCLFVTNASQPHEWKVQTDNLVSVFRSAQHEEMIVRASSSSNFLYRELNLDVHPLNLQEPKQRHPTHVLRNLKMRTPIEDEKNWFDSMATVLEQNTVGVKLGIYGLGLAGCCYAIRSVRPFTKFRTSKDIPKSFYESKIRLSGQVVGLRFLPDSTLLLVDHRPVLLAKLRKRGALPVSVEGVSITPNGVCWLQTIVKDDEVDFQLLEPKGESVSCIVYHKKQDVAKRLLGLGFASVAPFNLSFQSDPSYSQYYKELLKLETKAEKKKVGMWWDDKAYFSLTSSIIRKIKQALPSVKTVPLLR